MSELCIYALLLKEWFRCLLSLLLMSLAQLFSCVHRSLGVVTDRCRNGQWWRLLEHELSELRTVQHSHLKSSYQRRYCVRWQLSAASLLARG